MDLLMGTRILVLLLSYPRSLWCSTLTWKPNFSPLSQTLEPFNPPVWSHVDLAAMSTRRWALSGHNPRPPRATMFLSQRLLPVGFRPQCVNPNLLILWPNCSASHFWRQGSGINAWEVIWSLIHVHTLPCSRKGLKEAIYANSQE